MDKLRLQYDGVYVQDGSQMVAVHSEGVYGQGGWKYAEFYCDFVARELGDVAVILIWIESKKKRGRVKKGTSIKMFNELKKEILDCRECETKFGFTPHPIVMGNEHSKIMQINQAPSQNVHKTLKPFNDASGRKLRNEWYHISDSVFYDPNCFYIASIAHCSPGKAPTGGDRLPPKSCARKWLAREIELVDNEIFILLGRKAAEFFFPKIEFTELIFRDNMIHGKTAYVLPHPSPLNAKWFKDHPELLKKRYILCWGCKMLYT